MKIQLASDLHLEFLNGRWPGERVISPAPEADLLVLAGDVSTGAKAIQLFADWPVPVLYVAGNHEFYRGDLAKVSIELAKASGQGAVRFLENQVIKMEGVRFLGATLWTDYRLDPGLSQEQAMSMARQRLTDHSVIRLDGGSFTPGDALRLHEACRAWLRAELDKPFAGKTVVITHHGPHPKSIHSDYEGDPLNPAFASDLSELLPGADLWLHGHVHNSFDYQVGRCWVVANPLGYPRNLSAAESPERLVFENVAFERSLVVSL